MATFHRFGLFAFWAMTLTCFAQDSFHAFISGNRYVLLPDEAMTITGEALTQDPVDYTWDLGDGRTLMGQMVDIRYPEPGAYRLTLKAKRSDGVEASPFTQWVFVNDPLASVDSGKSAPFKFVNTPLLGESFTVGTDICFDGTALDSEGDAVTLFWDFDDGTVAEGMPSIKKAYHNPGNYNPRLWARDTTGLTETYPTFVTVAIYEGTKPPDGKIVAPKANRIAFNNPVFELKEGESLTLQGTITDVEDPSDYNAYWIAYGNLDTHMVDGLNPAPVTWPADYYYLYLHVQDPQGLDDPIVDEVQVWVRNDNRAPENVSIVEPNFDKTLFPGEGLDLSAIAVDLDGDPMQFEWILSDGRRFNGAHINRVPFSEPGLYSIQVIARDDRDAEGQPSILRYVMVNGGADNCTESPPTPFPILPQETRIAGPVGLQVQFQTGWDTSTDQTIEEVFWDFSHGLSSSGSTPDPIRFNEPGWHPIRVFLKNQCGNWSSTAPWSVFIYGDNIPPESTITSPQPNATNAFNKPVYATPIGTPVNLAATVTDPDGHLPITLRWEISEVNPDSGIYETRVYSLEENPPPVAFQTAGPKSINLIVFDSRGVQEVFPTPLEILVIDPSLKPDSQIVLPDGNFTVEPGAPLSFEGFAEDPNGLAVSYSWDFGPNAQASNTAGPWIQDVVFPQSSPPGEPFIVSLKASTLFTEEDTPATLQITVRQFEDSDFEPNNSLSQASSIQQGIYSQLVLEDGDQADFYRFDVAGEDRNLVLQVSDSDQSLQTELFRLDGDQWQPFPLDSPSDNPGSFSIQDLPSGSYAVSLSSIAARKRRAVAYGLSIATVQPSQFVPFLVEDESLRSHLGIINPNGEEVFVQAIGLDASGRQVADIGFRLNAGERRYAPSISWFGGNPEDATGSAIRWVRISSERRLVSYMVTESLDQTQLMSSGGITSLTDQITIPHIANPDNGWYTRAVVVQGRGASENLAFQSPELSIPIADQAIANSQEDFRFRERVAGDLPAWGQFTSENQAGLAGVEVFGRTDSKRQMSAIEMIDTQRNNPNFLYIGNDIYFTHIAADTVNWWTGISLINTDNQPARYQIIGYDRNGQELVRLPTETLPPGGKLLKTSQAIFGDLAVDWMKVEGDGRLAGFELFGDPDLNRAAGFKAATFVTDELYFPHVSTTAPQWTGISLVNVAATPTAITIEAFNDQGQSLAVANQTLTPFSKRLDLAQNLFGAGGLPPGTTYLRVRADQRALAGFELFGTLTPTGLPANQLAGLAAIPF